MVQRPLRVLWLGDSDIGGQGARAVAAFHKHGAAWTLRSMVKERQYMAYAVDLPYRRPSLDEQYQACDVIHVRNHFTDYDMLAAKFGLKPVVIHYHGTKFRSNPQHYLRQQRERGAIGIVSTLDLYLLAPDHLEWLPAPYDVDALGAMR